MNGMRANVPDGYTPIEEQNASALVEEYYDELLRIARTKRIRSGVGETCATTDLLHESFMKLSGERTWTSHDHFIRSAVLAMRSVIVDYARRRMAEKRGAGERPASIDENEALLPEFNETPETILAIADTLQQLRDTQPRWMQIIDARYFGGLTEEETAEMLNLSPRTVRRDWKAARAWVGEQLGV